MKLTWQVTIVDVREKSLTVSGKRGANGTAELEVASAGWWITLGGGMSLYAGETKPDCEKGDKLKLTIEHMDRSENASNETQG